MVSVMDFRLTTLNAPVKRKGLPTIAAGPFYLQN